MFVETNSIQAIFALNFIVNIYVADRIRALCALFSRLLILFVCVIRMAESGEMRRAGGDRLRDAGDCAQAGGQIMSCHSAYFDGGQISSRSTPTNKQTSPQFARLSTLLWLNCVIFRLSFFRRRMLRILLSSSCRRRRRRFCS